VAVTLIAAVIAIVLALPGGVDATEVVADTIVAQGRGPDGPAPAALPDDGLPRASFSDFARQAGWLPLSARDDDVDGRQTQTIYWERAGRRIAYTLLPGDPVGAPAYDGRTGRRGVLLYSLNVGARNAVTWTEATTDGGRTAVVSAIGVPVRRLYDLAGGPEPSRP
jgi:hypothetical protein